MKLKVDRNFLQMLSRGHIFTTRSGMGRTPPHPEMRWTPGTYLDFKKSAAIEQFSTIGSGNTLYSTGSFSAMASSFTPNTTIGRYVEVATGCRVLGFRHPIESVSINSAIFNFYRENIYPYFKIYEEQKGILNNKQPVPTPQTHSLPIRIGHDVWFGNNVTFNGGLTIGSGAVIAANAVLTHDVPPYAIVAGVPAKVKKLRFSDSVVTRLLESNWWNYELGDFFLNGFDFSNPVEFLAQFEEMKEVLSIYTPKVLYPLEFCLMQKFGNNLPHDFVCTDHISLLGIDKNTRKIIHLFDGIDSNFYPLSIELTNGKYCLKISILNTNVLEIHSDLSVTLGNGNPENYCVRYNDNNTLSIECSGGFISANQNGLCSIKSWNRDWEQFSPSQKFKNSICKCMN